MKAKRLIAMLLSLVIITMSFTACNGGDSKPVNSSDKASNQSSETEKTESKEMTKTEKAKSELNFGGETITITYPPGWNLINTDGTDPALVRRDARIAELEQKYNVKVVQRNDAANYWENMATSIASGSPEGHIMLSGEAQILPWIAAGAVADLSAAMEKTGIDFKDETKYSQVVRKYTNYNNKQYGFSQPFPFISVPYWYFNKRIFEEMQLGDPYKMVENKEWTWDKVTELAQKATKRKADGTIEQYGLGTMLYSSFLEALCESNGTTVAAFNDKGEPVLSLADPKGMKAFQQLSDWIYKDKITLANDGEIAWDATISDFVNGNVAIFCGSNPVLNQAKATPMADDFGVLPPPMGPDVKDYTIGACMSEFYFIPKTYEEMADKLLLFLDDLYALPEGMTREDSVAEKYTSYVRDEQSLKYYTQMALNYDKNLYSLLGVGGIEWSNPSIMTICYQVAKGEATPGDVVQKNKVQLETIMKDTLGTMKWTGQQ